MMSHLKEKNSQERVSLVCYAVLRLSFLMLCYVFTPFFLSMLYPVRQLAAHINVKTNHLCTLTRLPTALRYIQLDGQHYRRVCIEKGCLFQRHTTIKTRCVCYTSEKKTVGKKKTNLPHQTPITRRVPLWVIQIHKKEAVKESLFELFELFE